MHSWGGAGPGRGRGGGGARGVGSLVILQALNTETCGKGLVYSNAKYDVKYRAKGQDSDPSLLKVGGGTPIGRVSSLGSTRALQ